MKGCHARHTETVKAKWGTNIPGALAAGMRHKVAHGQRLRTPAARSSIWSSIWSTRRSIWSGRGSTWSARRSIWGAGTSILSARRSMWSARGSLDGPFACSCTICMHLACISVYLSVLDRPRRGLGGPVLIRPLSAQSPRLSTVVGPKSTVVGPCRPKVHGCRPLSAVVGHQWGPMSNTRARSTS